MGTTLVEQVPGVEIPRKKDSQMRVICLLYHDVIEESDWNSSGFTGPGTSKYKLSRREFEAHVASIAKVRHEPPKLAHELTAVIDDTVPFLLTFDDGGESAITAVAGILKELGWSGHFFVTVDQIGKKGFLNTEQIRSLRRKGHVIGSHSFSHPMRMSRCSEEELVNEWTSSIKILSEILNEQVDTASVPGGYYSNRVGETAAKAGIRVLFNSEPTTAIHSVLGCLVVGRYNISRGMRLGVSGDLVSVHSRERSRQWLYWNFKKLAKTFAGRSYLAARQWLLREK
jgi:peptidoglycan/xylan/chitin deacetylase (PgdA/CDA1 family)